MKHTLSQITRLSLLSGMAFLVTLSGFSEQVSAEIQNESTATGTGGEWRYRETRKKGVGYLANFGPARLRFTDKLEKNDRPEAPALPEWSFLSEVRKPYLVQSELSNEELASREILSSMILDMDPYVIESGMKEIIGENSTDPEELFPEEEMGPIIIDPNEIRILLETSTYNKDNRPRALIPFSPTVGEPVIIESSASYTIEE